MQNYYYFGSILDRKVKIVLLRKVNNQVLLWDKISKREEDIKLIILFFIVAVYPFIVIPGPIDFFRGPRYVFLAAVALLGIYVLYKENIRLKSPAFIPLGLLLLCIFLSAFFSQDSSTGFIGCVMRFTGWTTYAFCAVLFLLALGYGLHETFF